MICFVRIGPLLLLGILVDCRATSTFTLQGMVTDENGPLAGATVRIQGTTNAVQTDLQGNFLLRNLPSGVPVVVSAWQDGYYCAKTDPIAPPASDVTLHLLAYQTNDNPTYTWIPPVGENSCYSCKPKVTQVWLENDIHSRAASDPLFLTMYNGADVHGNQSPLTQYSASPDYGNFPLPPDPNQPYFGPGYKLDFPNTAGNCAACHLPGGAVDHPYGTDPNTGSGANAFGVHCDFCHKIAAVKLDPQTNLPYPNMPGVLSMDIRRPFTSDPQRYQLFFGTFDDDNVPAEDTYLPLIKESAFCAPCHYGVFWDTPIYNSYGEWLASTYNDPKTGKSCQDCHMPVPTLLDGQPLTNVAAGKGGIERNPATLHAHTFPGGSDETLLQHAISLQATASLENTHLSVSVTITNDQTGHDVPTDSPLRQLILLVQVRDSQGQLLPLLEGPVVPEWGGIGDPQAGYYAGQAGKIYARILEETWTKISPSGAYWNPTRVLSDNRLAPFEVDTSTYTFAVPGNNRIITTVTLLYRRAYIVLRDQKGWNVPDIVMDEKTLSIP